MKWVQFERKFKKSFSKKKVSILSPLLGRLADVGITPDMVSYAGMLSMLVFFYFSQTDLVVASWFLVLALVLDLVDGGLANYLNISSDRGKFIDMLMDNLSFVIFVLAMVNISMIDSLTGIVLAYFMFLCVILLIIKKNRNKKSDWLFHPFAGSFPHIMRGVIYGMFFVLVIFGVNLFYPWIYIIAAALIAKSVQDFFSVKAA